MDPLVDNDTHALHWSLDKDDSTLLLEAIFPDTKLLIESVARGKLVPSEVILITTVPEQLTKLYRKGTKGNLCWLGFPTFYSSHTARNRKSGTAEQKMSVQTTSIDLRRRWRWNDSGFIGIRTAAELALSGLYRDDLGSTGERKSVR